MDNIIDISEYRRNVSDIETPVTLLVFGATYFNPFSNSDAQHVMRISCRSEKEAFQVIDWFREDGFLMHRDGEYLRLSPWPPASMHIVRADAQESQTHPRRI